MCRPRCVVCLSSSVGTVAPSVFAGLTFALIALILDLIIIWAFFSLAPLFSLPIISSPFSPFFFPFLNSRHSALFQCIQEVDFVSLALQALFET